MRSPKKLRPVRLRRIAGNRLAGSRADKRIAFLSLSALAFTATSTIQSQDSQLDAAGPLITEPVAPPIRLVSDEESLREDARAEQDILWLARCAYSETKRPHEQRLVAWVVRNRVETEYRGRSTYKDIVLDPFQFSAFNPGGPKRGEMLALTLNSQVPGWQKALHVAREVYDASHVERPFNSKTRHFYSEQSMVDRAAPAWARGRRAVTPQGVRVEPKRFRFYAGVASLIAM